jgi:adenylosuccinate synthase
MYGAEPLDANAVAAEFVTYARRLAPHLCDGSALLSEALDAGKNVLAEGAQGTLLDVDHGTYPFVTSSNPTAGGVLTGLGVGPKVVGRILGVTKAFTSRVGSGPFPTELDGALAERLRGTGENPWDEYGTTTGRPRRVGWLDMVMLHYARRINSLTELALTKLDVLSGLETIQIAVAYELDGARLTHFPTDDQILSRCRPVYETIPGWREDVTGARTWRDLPGAAQAYIERIAALVGLPITMVSVGPGRDQVILRPDQP